MSVLSTGETTRGILCSFLGPLLQGGCGEAQSLLPAREDEVVLTEEEEAKWHSEAAYNYLKGNNKDDEAKSPLKKKLQVMAWKVHTGH